MQKILRWHHTGFNVHSQVRAQTKKEAERVNKYMIPVRFTMWIPSSVHPVGAREESNENLMVCRFQGICTVF